MGSRGYGRGPPGARAGGRQVIGQPVVLGQGLDDGDQLGVAPTHLAGPGQIGVHGRVGERGLELGELSAQRVGRLEHAYSSP